MSLFSAENIEGIAESFEDDAVNAVVESIIVDEICKMDDEAIREWCATDECAALCEAQVLRKPTAMRLSKADDFKRREKIAAYTLARQANDPLFRKMIKARVMWKTLSDKILAKYNAKATRTAKKAQAKYIKDYSKNLKAGKVVAQKLIK